jgi:hypothetical protein
MTDGWMDTVCFYLHSLENRLKVDPLEGDEGLEGGLALLLAVRENHEAHSLSKHME